MADVPFVPEKWQEIYNSKGADGFGPYCAIFRAKEYSELDWKQYNDVYVQLEEQQRMEDAMPQLKEENLRKKKELWGMNYDEEEIAYLENLYRGIADSHNIVDDLNEDQARKLCKISLLMDENIRAGLDIDKLAKTYETITKLANLEPKDIKDGKEFESVGEVFAYLEKLGHKVPRLDPYPKDEVDTYMNKTMMWLRYLYSTETNIGEEIDRRIENLKIADKLEGNDYDWNSYEAAEKEFEKTEEEFEVNLDG